MNQLVNHVSQYEVAQGDTSSTYSWDSTTGTLSGIGSGTSANASKLETVMQNVLTLYNAVSASTGTGDAAVNSAIATLYVPAVAGTTGSLTAVSAISGGTSTVSDGHEVDWGSSNYQTDLTNVLSQIENVNSSLQTQSSKLANNLSIITTREAFTDSEINILDNGADKLTSADMNEEGANLLSLQTSQSLAVQSLTLASSAASNVLTIIRG